jgi:hypothetical protein
VPIKLFLCHWLIDLGQFPSVTGHGFSEKHEVYSNGLAAHDNPCTKGSWETLGRIHAPKVSVEPQEVSRFFSSPPFLCSSSHEIITRTPVEGTLLEACSMIFVRFAVQIIILTDCVPAIRAGIDSYFSAELAHRLTSGPRCASLLVVLTLALLSGAESLLSLQCSWTANPRSPALASHETPPSYWIIPLQFILTQRNIEGTSTTSVIPNPQATENIGAQTTLYVRSRRGTRQLTLSFVGSSRAA